MADDSWLIVGLGNPGPEYAGNRHNAGFLVVDLLAERMRSKFKAHKGRADIVEGHLGGPGGQRVILAKPKAYMNESGGPVASMRDFYKVPLDRIVAIHDELDIPYGSLRLKLGGGDNGHNGLKSLRKSLGSGEFYRVRFGIGRPPGRMDPAAFVLRDFSAAERKDLDFLVDRAADSVGSLLTDGLDRAQNAYHAEPA
jgi:peptidyl-tRNA hydrolase, PTH1 family